MLEWSVNAFAAVVAQPMTVRLVVQLSQQAASALQVVGVTDPDLGQRLVGRYLAGYAAGVGALHARADTCGVQLVHPQGSQGEVGSLLQFLHGDEAMLPRMAAAGLKLRLR